MPVFRPEYTGEGKKSWDFPPGWDVSYLTGTIWLSRIQKYNVSIDLLGLTRGAT